MSPERGQRRKLRRTSNPRGMEPRGTFLESTMSHSCLNCGAYLEPPIRGVTEERSVCDDQCAAEFAADLEDATDQPLHSPGPSEGPVDN